MAATEEHAPLLPSPPSSPPRRRKHKKKKSDPFFDLATTPLPSPSAPSPPANEPEEQESLVTRIILTPILFTSFLLSLFLVNHRDRTRRTTSSPPTSTPSSLLSYFSLTSSLWIDPEPYQDPSSTAWNRRDSSHVKPDFVLRNADNEDDAGQLRRNKDADNGKRKGDGAKKRNSWHLHKKIRKVAKLEISDAFEMRSRVIAVLLFGLLVGVVGVIFGIRWVLGKILWGRESWMG